MTSHTLLVVVLLGAALLAVQAVDPKRSLLNARLGGLTAAQLQALAAATTDTACQAANPTTATELKNVCDGCTKRKQCIFVGGTIDWVSTAAEACPANAPYCNDGECSTTVPSTACSAPKPDDSFTCSAAGYFPNLSSCSKYWICVTRADGTLDAYAGDCSGASNAVFDPRTSLCVPKAQSTCTTLTCKSAGVVVYESAPWLYAVCQDNTLQGALLFSCPNTNMRYTDRGCANACNAAGRFPWRSAIGQVDPTSYFDCVQNGKTFSGPLKGACPGTTTFDEHSSQCKAAGGGGPVSSG